MDKSREDFEAWLKNVYIRQGLNHKYLWGYDEQEDRYSHRASQVRWEAWQASRAAVEIEFNDTFSPNDCGDHAVWLDVAEKVIRNHGIRIEGDKP